MYRFSDHSYKILLLGETGAGKTSLLTRYVDKVFLEQAEFNSPDHDDVKIKRLDCSGLLVDLELWDLPAKSIDPKVLAHLNGVMFCYNISDKESFSRLSYWLEQVDKYSSDMVCKVLVGTHSDLARSVDSDTAKELSERLNIPSVDTSAKTGSNVRAAFMTIVKELLTHEYPWGKFNDMRVRVDGEGRSQEEDSSSESCVQFKDWSEIDGKKCSEIIVGNKTDMDDARVVEFDSAQHNEFDDIVIFSFSDGLFKVLLTGNAGVGKSSLLMRYATDIYQDEYVPTIGLDFKVKLVTLKGKRVKLQLWDTGGQEQFRTITNSYYRGCNAILLVYDVTDQESFIRLKDWIREVDAYCNDDVIKILVGNKSDRSDARVVDLDTAKAFAAEQGVDVMEVSAKTGDNVENLFTEMTSKLLDFLGDSPGHKTLRLHDREQQRHRQGGCCSVL
ncbi:ras and EF-hand domain-containing protein-like [Liolophura sinensis]|uniref:ras and EF-hand domain-containing protein-like n=1 Tax=Liolophura sinensis TaxID=3198878 RepID=UPI0031586FD1